MPWSNDFTAPKPWAIRTKEITCFQSEKEVLLKMDNLDLEYSILNSKVVPFAIYSTQIGFLYNARVGLEDGD